MHIEFSNGVEVPIKYFEDTISLTHNNKVGEYDIINRNLPKFTTGNGKTDLKFTVEFITTETSRIDIYNIYRTVIGNSSFSNNDERALMFRLHLGQLFDTNDWWVLESINIDFSIFNDKTLEMPKNIKAIIAACLHRSTSFLSRDKFINSTNISRVTKKIVF